MKKTISILASILFVMVFMAAATVVVARPDLPNKANEHAQEFSLPDTAAEVAEDMYYLGEARDTDGTLVEGYAFVRRKGANQKPPWAGGGNKTNDVVCYDYLSKGTNWKTNESWIVNPANSGIESYVYTNLKEDIAKWEDAANYDILGIGSSTTETLTADTSSPDGSNEVLFTGIDDPGAIAVTIVWGYFNGPPPQRHLVEWDQVYDNVDYSWSSSGENGKMDFENIATHELGHAVGMADLYDSSCSEETMYGYAGFGETNKRSLEQPDITGVSELYK